MLIRFEYLDIPAVSFYSKNPKASPNKSFKEVFISAGEVTMGQGEHGNRETDRDREHEEKRRGRAKGTGSFIALRWI